MIECKWKCMYLAHERFKASEITRLDEVYKVYSPTKWQAYNNCYDFALQLKFYRFGRFKILSHNTMNFSVGFYGKVDNDIAFVWITKDYIRYIKLADLILLEEKYSNR